MANHATTTVVIPSTLNEKIATDNNKHHSKPLPVLKPTLAIDDSSRIHVSKLLNNWLTDLNIPIKPWSDVLFNIVMTLYEKTVNANTTITTTTNNTIWVQTFTNNSPMESKFLCNVFHGKLVSNDELSIEFPIGGTIRIYGLNDETISAKLIDLVQTLVYLTYSLYLESYVMRDSHVKLITSSTPQQQQQKEASTTKPNSDDDSNKNHPSITKKLSGLFNWFKKLAPHHHSAVTLPPTPPPSIASEKATKRRSNPLNTVGEGIKRGLSLSNIGKRYQVPPPPLLPQQQDFELIKQGDPHRFYKLKQKIEHAYISTSPDCHFPYPALLNRLEIEEDELISEQRKLIMNNNEMECNTPNTTRPMQRRRSSLISTFSSMKRNSITTTTDVQLPQTTTAYSSIRVPSLLADSKKGLEHLILDTTSLKSFKHHQSITLGFTVYPIGCPDRPCLGPIMSTMDYFRYHAPESSTTTTGIFPHIDQTLGHTIRQWCTTSQSSCQIHMDHQIQFLRSFVETPQNTLPAAAATPGASAAAAAARPDLEHMKSDSSVNTVNSTATVVTSSKRHCSKFHGCHQPLIDHVYSFAHGIGKVSIYASAAAEEEVTTTYAKDDKITTWISCSTCDAATAPILLSDKSDQLSFAKYLELVFYSTKLSSPQPFCEHTKENNKSAITRCFHYNRVTLKFIYEDAKYYDLRVPRIQLAADGATTTLPTEYSTPRMGMMISKEWKHKSATQDVDLLFMSVRTRLDLLNHYVKAEGRRKIRGSQNNPVESKKCQAELKSLEGEIKVLSKRLDTDHQSLLQILADTNLNELNDFRRYFAIQSESIIQYLSDWQKINCEEVTDTIGWDSPDYISSKTVHCFPGSSVLVREDEPTSIIAYTLSSNEYIQEILCDEGTEYGEKDSANSSTTKNFSMPSLSSSAGTTTETVADQPTDNNKKPLSLNVIDGYYSSIERKYISPSAGASTETASFRTMVIEVVKSTVVEAQINNSKRLEDLKARLSPWSKKPEELEAAEGRHQLTERTLKPLDSIQQQQQQQQQQVETKEVKVASYFYENNIVKDSSKKNISPHIKHKFVHEGIEFTCIVYYAKEFETLRKRCDINQLIIQSLSRCQSWTASGGKSKSHFYKTQDDRLVIKEMMNAWNVAEKDAFLKFAPKYFEHMERSANEPSVLAKIFGFFTIRMKNTIDKKSPLLNLDVLVMEHLFYNQNIIRRFDFKGIQDRHVEEFRKQQKDTTLWDGDWIHEYRTRLPVHEQSKSILELAINNDTEFLSKCNIMDYSLLVGIDQEKYEMTVGIVDFIGAYTWYKKLESRSKSTLQRSREVTVVPPDQYKTRFNREVCDYFIPVPGKFDLVAPSNTLPSLLI